MRVARHASELRAFRQNPEHPDWWIEQLEYLEAIDEPGGVAFGHDTELEPTIVFSMERRGLVATRVQPVDIRTRTGWQRLEFRWVELTELGRDVFERDLPPPVSIPRELSWPEVPGRGGSGFEPVADPTPLGAPRLEAPVTAAISGIPEEGPLPRPRPRPKKRRRRRRR